MEEVHEVEDGAVEVPTPEDSLVVETARVRYVFLDIVGFTNNRSVEAQSDIVGTLNDVVTEALGAVAPDAETIFLPTGDGMAVALLNVLGFDVHLRLALEILRRMAEYNANTQDPMRRFEVRIGINENIDNVVTDINGRRNVAGAGISMAQRIMDQADGGQVLVGQTVYEVLRQREKYLSSFRRFSAVCKHNATFGVHQYVSEEAPGLNVAVPSAFVTKRADQVTLTKFAAYFMAHAIQNYDFLFSRRGDSLRDYAGTVLLALLAEDSVEVSETPAHEEPNLVVWHPGIASFEEQYGHYCEVDFWILVRLAHLLEETHLSPYSTYCDRSGYRDNYVFVGPAGLTALRQEWPTIAKEFKLDGGDVESGDMSEPPDAEAIERPAE